MPPFSSTNQPSKRRRRKRRGAKSRKGGMRSKVVSLGGKRVRIRYDICSVVKGPRRARRCPTGRRRKKR
jgi:hypothetical protein